MEKDTDLAFLPRTKDGLPDRRFEISFQRILNEAGSESIDELRQFAEETENIQRKAAKAGMSLAVAIFNEANYLEANHRFDPDNRYGWRSKSLRKQAQVILETIGFKQKNAHKLVTSASWLTSRSIDKNEREWLGSLSPSHIYELTRMSAEGYARVKVEVSYPEFHFSAGQQQIPVKRLEEIRRQYPKTEGREHPATNHVESQCVDTNGVSTGHSRFELFEAVPDIDKVSLALPLTDPIHAGITMLIHSLTMIGSLDELSMTPHYLDKLRPHCMTLQILSDMLQMKTTNH